MNILNNKGFNFIEVIIAIVIVGLIVVSFSQLFSFSLDLPLVSGKSKALYYAQKEMERLNNTSFDNINSILRTNYPDDTNYDYEIIVKENQPQNKKEVLILFYYKNKQERLVELYSQFIKLGILELCEDFQDGNWNAPTWNWVRSPQGLWTLVIYPPNSGNYRANFSRRQWGYIYPNWNGSSNYSLSVDFYIQNIYSINSSRIRFYGRYNNNTNNGYFVEIETSIIGINESYTYFYLYKIVNGTPILLDQYYLNYPIFNDWHNIKLSMFQNRLNVYFDGGTNPIISSSDSQFTSGSIRISVESQLRANNVYFDNVCVREVSQ